MALVVDGARPSGAAKPVLALAWAITIVIGLVAVAGTRDFLTYEHTVWNTAHEALSNGVERTQISAGASFDGYHLYDLSRENGWSVNTPPEAFAAFPPPGLWWVRICAPITEARYVVAAGPADGYVVIREVQFNEWLRRGPGRVYLLVRVEPRDAGAAFAATSATE